MSMSKTAERAIMEQGASTILPHSAHLETYGLSACLDFVQAWQKALDYDMPMECFQRDRDAVRVEAKACHDECRRRLDNAQKEANRIIKAAEDRAAKLSAMVNDRMRQAVKACEAI